MTESQKSYILKKTSIEEQKTFFYGKEKNVWFYVSDLMNGDPEKFQDVLFYVFYRLFINYCHIPYSLRNAICLCDNKIIPGHNIFIHVTPKHLHLRIG